MKVSPYFFRPGGGPLARWSCEHPNRTLRVKSVSQWNGPFQTISNELVEKDQHALVNESHVEVAGSPPTGMHPCLHKWPDLDGRKVSSAIGHQQKASDIQLRPRCAKDR